MENVEEKIVLRDVKSHCFDKSKKKVKVRSLLRFKNVKKTEKGVEMDIAFSLAKRNFNHEKREDIERVSNILEERINKRPIELRVSGENIRSAVNVAKNVVHRYMEEVSYKRTQDIKNETLKYHIHGNSNRV